MSYKAKILAMIDDLEAINANPISFAKNKSKEPITEDDQAEIYAIGWAVQTHANIRLYLDLMETENAELANLAFGAGSK